MRGKRSIALVLVVSAASLLTTTAANAQDRIGGHFGLLLPLVTRGQSSTTTIADDVVFGFPTGITIRTSDKIAFDLELVPLIQNEPLEVFLTIHPGVIVSIANRTAAGVRMAFDVGATSWGFTPLINRQLTRAGATSVFVEAVVPIRFQQDFRGGAFVSVGLGIHGGIGF